MPLLVSFYFRRHLACNGQKISVHFEVLTAAKSEKKWILSIEGSSSIPGFQEKLNDHLWALLYAGSILELY